MLSGNSVCPLRVSPEIAFRLSIIVGNPGKDMPSLQKIFKGQENFPASCAKEVYGLMPSLMVKLVEKLPEEKHMKPKL
jgi:hypothetical protein